MRRRGRCGFPCPEIPLEIIRKRVVCRRRWSHQADREPGEGVPHILKQTLVEYCYRRLDLEHVFRQARASGTRQNEEMKRPVGVRPGAKSENCSYL